MPDDNLVLNLMEKIMSGTVFHQHPEKNIFSVQLENGDYSVVELTGLGAANFGDRITGRMGKTGHAILTNQTSLTDMEVIIRHIHCSRVDALQKTTLL
jgi:hypothetical protein